MQWAFRIFPWRLTSTSEAQLPKDPHTAPQTGANQMSKYRGLQESFHIQTTVVWLFHHLQCCVEIGFYKGWLWKGLRRGTRASARAPSLCKHSRWGSGHTAAGVFHACLAGNGDDRHWGLTDRWGRGCFEPFPGAAACSSHTVTGSQCDLEALGAGASLGDPWGTWSTSQWEEQPPPHSPVAQTHEVKWPWAEQSWNCEPEGVFWLSVVFIGNLVSAMPQQVTRVPRDGLSKVTPERRWSEGGSHTEQMPRVVRATSRQRKEHVVI